MGDGANCECAQYLFTMRMTLVCVFVEAYAHISGCRIARAAKGAQIGLPWPQTWHLHIPRRRKCDGPIGHGPQGFGTQGALVTVGRLAAHFRPILVPKLPVWAILSRNTATDQEPRFGPQPCGLDALVSGCLPPKAGVR